MVQYDLTHLIQRDTQDVLGPIQDDEALFLYSIIRGMRLERVLELGGGMEGYSGLNFCRAVGPLGKVYTVDIIQTPQQGHNHKVIHKNAMELTADDVDAAPLDLVFFDCHDRHAQLECFSMLLHCKLITDDTLLALHDTNVHYYPTTPACYLLPQDADGGSWVHQPVERSMVNDFADMGYHVFNLHPQRRAQSITFPFRHGVTLCQKYRRLAV